MWLICLLMLGEPEPLPSSIMPSAELRERFDKQVKERNKSELKPSIHRIQAAHERIKSSFVARLEEINDYIIHVSRPLTPAQKRLLMVRGLPVVETLAEVPQEGLLRGRHHRRIRLSNALQKSPSIVEEIEALLGQEVQLELSRSPLDAHLEVVQVLAKKGDRSE